jgi:ligand-binding SRPBCC domain-containing protein
MPTRMTLHTLSTELLLPKPRSEVFRFFADARNLEAITPPWVQFQILTPGVIEMRPGALIDYRIKIHGIPVRWRTEITGWEPPFRFVDEQRRGPYRRWIHTHTFEEHPQGTLCRDHVQYAVWGGQLIHWLFVRRDVQRIFQYRTERLNQLFPAAPVTPR